MQGIIVHIHPQEAHLSVGEICARMGEQVHPNEYHFYSLLSALGFVREQGYDAPSPEYQLHLLKQLTP